MRSKNFDCSSSVKKCDAASALPGHAKAAPFRRHELIVIASHYLKKAQQIRRFDDMRSSALAWMEIVYHIFGFEATSRDRLRY
jgi:hypothetical protein